MSNTRQKQTLVAFCGNHPEYTLRILGLLPFPVDECVLIHLAGADILQMVLTIGNTYSTKITVRAVALTGYGALDSEDALEAAGRLIGEVVIGAKQHKGCLHIALADGDRMFAASVMSIAMLHFEDNDRLWDLSSEPDLAEQHLIRLPLITLPRAIQWSHRSSMQPSYDAVKCQAVFDQATPAQRRVLEVLADGTRPQQAAIQLGLKPATVFSHQTFLFALCRKVWQVEKVSIWFVVQNFGPFFKDQQGAAKV